MSQVLLASKSDIKLTALSNTLNCNVLPVESLGHNRVNQPVGYPAARECAKNRIADIIPDPNEAAGVMWLIAIENYIDQSGKKWWDAPMIVIASADGTIVAESPPWKRRSKASVPVPKQYATAAMQQSTVSDLGWSVTVGELIGADRGTPANDWHKGRVNQISQALKILIHVNERRHLLRDSLTFFPDYPKPGILFQDMNSLLADKVLYAELLKLLCMWVPQGTTHITGMESRGFILGAAVAAKKKLSFVPIRKPGKLPGTVYREEYSKEYGTDALEVQADLLGPNDRVVIFDDILATGGTALAAYRLVTRCGAEVNHFVVVNDVPPLREQASDKLKGINYTVLL